MVQFHRIDWGSQIHAVHEYAVLPRPGVKTSPGYERVSRTVLQIPQKNQPLSDGVFHRKQLLRSFRSGSGILPDRSFYPGADHPESGSVLSVLSSGSVHAVRCRSLHNVPSNKDFQSLQRNERYCFPDPEFPDNDIPGNSPSRHSCRFSRHRCVHCVPHQIAGHCVSDCKSHFCRNGHCALSVSLCVLP